MVKDHKTKRTKKKRVIVKEESSERSIDRRDVQVGDGWRLAIVGNYSRSIGTKRPFIIFNCLPR